MWKMDLSALARRHTAGGRLSHGTHRCTHACDVVPESGSTCGAPHCSPRRPPRGVATRHEISTGETVHRDTRFSGGCARADRISHPCPGVVRTAVLIRANGGTIEEVMPAALATLSRLLEVMLSAWRASDVGVVECITRSLLGPVGFRPPITSLSEKPLIELGR